MRQILIAEDNPVSHKLLSASLSRMGFDPVSAVDGEQAWQMLSRPDRPRLALLDWMMPGLNGPEVCRRVREASAGRENAAYTYLILLTARSDSSDVAEGLRAGADDYLTKPFDRVELKCRLDVGERVLALNNALEHKISQYKQTIEHLQRLEAMLPICMHCSCVRDNQDRWQDLEAYMSRNAGIIFSHSLCDSCWSEHYPDIPRTAVVPIARTKT